MHRLGKSVKYFLFWRLLLFLIAFVATLLIPFKTSFPYADTVLAPTGLPRWIWGFGNFDGVHYLRIAQNGYVDAFHQAFFPLYPFLIKLLNFLPRSSVLDTRIFVDPSYFYIALLLTSAFLVAAIIFINKLITRNNFYWYLAFLLSFPTSYYFAAIYTESLFLLLVILFMYYYESSKYFKAAVVVVLASITKVTGIILVVPLLYKLIKEVCIDKTYTNKLRLIVPIGVSLIGILVVFVYQYLNFGNPLSFLASQPGFGAERSAIPIVTLPQVYFRYWNMFTTVTDKYQLFTISNEVLFSLFGVFLVIWGYNKIRFEYYLVSLLMFLVPTLTGTFSSLPRYLVFTYILYIPVFLKLPLKAKKVFVITMGLFQIVLLSLFINGYWVS